MVVSVLSMDEFEIIKNYFKRESFRSDVLLGIGDDGAVLDLKALDNENLVMSTDTLVENVHFPPSINAGLIAKRALCTNLSDTAAMGAVPLWFTLSLTLPEENTTTAWLTDFSQGLFEEAEKFGCTLVGGDTVRGRLSITITICGKAPDKEVLKRTTAEPNDMIFVSGTLGDGRAALSLIQQQSLVSERLLSRFYSPQPMIDLGVTLRNLVSSCIDISDGLVSDLTHICNASKVSAVLDVSKLPVHEEVKQLFPDDFAEFGLYGGDDYQLCFTAPESEKAKIINAGMRSNSRITPIGRIVKSMGSNKVMLEGMDVNENISGYRHFG